MYSWVFLCKGFSDTVRMFVVFFCIYVTYSTSYGHLDWRWIHGMQCNFPHSTPLQHVCAVPNASAILKWILEVIFCDSVQLWMKFCLDHVSCVKMVAFRFYLQFGKQKEARRSIVVKALCYKPEGRRFETRWGEWFLSIYLTLPAALGPGVYSASNRNQHLKHKINVSGE
jgi:hypothetical protein